jgi:hypothetical protein
VGEPRGGDAEGRAAAARAAGLCASCRHARTQRSARGNTFWRCARAESDPRFLRYPPLPVARCGGHEAG